MVDPHTHPIDDVIMLRQELERLQHEIDMLRGMVSVPIPVSTRLERLKLRPNMELYSDALLNELLQESIELWLDHTHQPTDPGKKIDGQILEIATIKVNMLGGEGSSAASDGSMSRTWALIPDDLRNRMNGYRLVQ